MADHIMKRSGIFSRRFFFYYVNDADIRGSWYRAGIAWIPCGQLGCIFRTSHQRKSAECEIILKDHMVQKIMLRDRIAWKIFKISARVHKTMIEVMLFHCDPSI